MGIDLIGSGEKIVAVVELDEENRKIEDVAKQIMEDNKNVKTVIQEFPGTKGKFRLKKQKIIAGDKDTEVVHKEHGYTIKVDPTKVYFSPREGTVRLYVSSQVQPKEKILVMFAGAGPYLMAVSKLHPDVKEIIGVEINPEGVKYMKENIRMNRISHITTPVLDDVENFCKANEKEFDRIIMPMVHARDYLDTAISSAKTGGTIHIYMVSEDEDSYKDAEKFISETFKKAGREYEISGKAKISLFAPGKWKVLMEIKVKS